MQCNGFVWYNGIAHTGSGCDKYTDIWWKSDTRSSSAPSDQRDKSLHIHLFLAHVLRSTGLAWTKPFVGAGLLLVSDVYWKIIDSVPSPNAHIRHFPPSKQKNQCIMYSVTFQFREEYSLIISSSSWHLSTTKKNCIPRCSSDGWKGYLGRATNFCVGMGGLSSSRAFALGALGWEKLQNFSDLDPTIDLHRSEILFHCLECDRPF